MDYTTLAKVKQWSDILASKDDGLIQSLITACSAYADQHCRQVFGRRTVDALAATGTVDAYGRLGVWVDAPKVVSVAALRFRHPARPGQTEVPASDLWWEDQPWGAVIRTDSVRWGAYRGGRLHATLAGTLGWAEADVPPDFELAIRKLVLWAYKRRETAAEKTALPELGVVIIPQALPPDIKAALAEYTRVTGGA